MRSPCRLEGRLICAEVGQQLSTCLGVTMSPSFESSTRRSSICYVIEEEPSCDVEAGDSGHREQNEADLGNCHTIVSEDRVNIRMCDNGLDSVAKYQSERGHKNVFSELLILADVTDESGDDISSAIPVTTRKLSSGRRRPVTQSGTNSRSSPSHDTSLSEQDIGVSSNLEVKSGNLVMIVSEQGHKSASSISTRATSRTLHLSRYPVIVKIHRKSYEKYAIVSRTRRHPTMQSFFLKLKHSHVTQSMSNPSHFIVSDNGPAAKSITFEASSPEMAREWMEAFSLDFPPALVSSINNKHFQGSREHFPLGRLQPTFLSRPTCLVTSEAAPIRTFSHSPLMPALSESLAENDVEQMCFKNV